MSGLRAGMFGASLLAVIGLFGCEPGPTQKLGERIDKITDQDKVIGKGPAERAGKEIDKKLDLK